jgi:DNA-binding IscR family transcriptional regulator
VKSTRGQSGGYALCCPADQIAVGDVLPVLGGRLFESDYCERHPGVVSMCTHNVDCSIRSLWEAVQQGVDQVLSRTTLQMLLASEPERPAPVNRLVQIGGASEVPTTA